MNAVKIFQHDIPYKDCSISKHNQSDKIYLVGNLRKQFKFKTSEARTCKPLRRWALTVVDLNLSYEDQEKRELITPTL